MGNRDMRRRILSEGAIPFQIQPNIPVQISGVDYLITYTVGSHLAQCIMRYIQEQRIPTIIGVRAN